MQPSTEQSRWLLKVLQPEKTLGSLPGVAALSEAVRAALLGLPPDVYAAEQARNRYTSGTTMQLDLLQAQRDAFVAEVARIQADADLINARAQLRLAAGRSLTERGAQ